MQRRKALAAKKKQRLEEMQALAAEAEKQRKAEEAKKKKAEAAKKKKAAAKRKKNLILKIQFTANDNKASE